MAYKLSFAFAGGVRGGVGDLDHKYVTPGGETVNKTESPSQKVSGPPTIEAEDGTGSTVIVIEAEPVQPLAPVTIT